MDQRVDQAKVAVDSVPLIVAVAPNGARKIKADHPAIPLTPEEIAAEAANCAAAGAAMIHLHVRDDDGGHSLDAGRYREAIDAIRTTTGDGIIVQITTEAVGRYGPEEQMRSVRDVAPEAVSTAVRELVADAGAEAAAQAFFAWTRDAEILVQYILYDEADVRRFIDLRERGILPDGVASVLYVLGRYAKDQRSSPTDLLPFLEAARGYDELWHWSVCAFGPLEGACALTAAAFGGHARVGMENNLYLKDGSLTPDNAALVRQLAEGAAFLTRPTASAAVARSILSAPPCGSPYGLC